MKRTYAIVLMLLILPFVFIRCSDDDSFRRRLTPDERAAELKTQLGLTDEQTQQIKQILIESRERIAADREKFQGDRETMRRLMRENWEETERQIEEILDDEQKEKYQELRDQREERMRERRRPPRD